MTAFRRLAVASTITTFALVTVGGLVRATKSGLGCGTDWPRCSGRLLPRIESRAVAIEFSHRLLASVVVILLLVLVGAAIRHLRHQPRVLWPTVAALALVLSQALLGAVVVWLELEAVSVVAHLGLALSVLATLVYVTIAALVAEGRLTPAPDQSVSRTSGLVGLCVLVVMLLGSYVTGRDAGLVFADWPLMGGRLVPDLSVEPFALHFLHRGLAGVVGLVAVVYSVAVIKRKSELRAQASFARLVVALFVIEIALGALNVWTGLNPVVVTSHLATGAAIWTAVVAIAVLSHPALGRVHETGSIRTPAAYAGRA